MFDSPGQVEILPADRRRPDSPQSQILRETRDQVIDSPELSVALDQNVALSQSSPDPGQRLWLKSLGAQDISQRQQALSHCLAL